MVLLFWHSCKCPFFGGVITRDSVYSVDLSPDFNRSLQAEVSTKILASLPAMINSTGVLSTTADFPHLQCFNGCVHFFS